MRTALVRLQGAYTNNFIIREFLEKAFMDGRLSATAIQDCHTLICVVATSRLGITFHCSTR
jgi:hypothetical protein